MYRKNTVYIRLGTTLGFKHPLSENTFPVDKERTLYSESKRAEGWVYHRASI